MPGWKRDRIDFAASQWALMMQQNPPPLGAVDGCLDGIPRHDGRGEYHAVRDRGIGGNEAVVRPIVEATACKKTATVSLGCGRPRMPSALMMFAAVEASLSPPPFTSTRRTTFSCNAPSRFSILSAKALASAPVQFRSQLGLGGHCELRRITITPCGLSMPSFAASSAGRSSTARRASPWPGRLPGRRRIVQNKGAK